MAHAVTLSRALRGQREHLLRRPAKRRVLHARRPLLELCLLGRRRLRVQSPSGRHVALVAREEAGEEAGVQTRRMPLVDGNLRRLQRLDEAVDELEDLVLLLFGDEIQARELGFEQLV